MLRDNNGCLLVDFSAFFGEMHSLQAEMRAMLYGVRLASSRGYQNLHLESDSMMLIRVLNGETECPWNLLRGLDELEQHKGSFRSIRHCYREANMVADGLSRVGVQDRVDKIYDEERDLPRLVRGHLRLDKVGMPNLRRCKSKAGVAPA